MNPCVKNIELEGEIFTVSVEDFDSLALQIFKFQYTCNPVYRRYCDTLKIDCAEIDCIEKIPFLPIRFFKTHPIINTSFEAAAIFESSGTTGSTNSRHYVRELSLYESSFTKGFRLFYGDPRDWCILALLPAYLERSNSSLVMMADELVKLSHHPESGFYLDDWDALAATLRQLEKQGLKTLLLGVTFALLDFAERFPMRLQHTSIMETGGMKGRRAEITRQEVHELLCTSFQQEKIHSEYGMTELLSQAYSSGNGLFNTPPWMKILLREEDDPFAVHLPEATARLGAINVIDFANLYSCCFIATEDAGKLYPSGSFEVLGRLDNTDIRGCSLLSL